MILHGTRVLAEWFMSLTPRTELSWFKSQLDHLTSYVTLGKLLKLSVAFFLTK